ncbi:AsmA family protein [Salidesulfovibrio brasiliensis]|uniref:hypothetical protein n=1 Tax=Salidesulfovibrio brasiliensis TaxID=221711 RepID=UPI0006D0A78A|nr:hypothetical protein [Salidesulfovibrio brasiliensis]
MKKLIIYGVTGAVLALIVLIVLAVLNLGTLIKTATEEFGPKVTGTDVKLGSADISFLSGSGELNDFLLGNPQGFSTPEAFSVNTIRIKVNKDSLTSDRIIIEDVVILSPHITYEKLGKTDNFKTIIANVKKAVASEEKAEKKDTAKTEGEEGKSKAIQINHLLIKDPKVTVAGGMAKVFGDKGVDISVPDIELRDIGKEKRTTPAEAVEEILRAMTDKVTNSVSNVAAEVGKKAQEVMKQGTDLLKKGAEGSGDAVKGAMDSVKGIFQ